MDEFRYSTKRQMWATIRRGVERGTFKDYEDTVRAVHALRAGYRTIYLLGDAPSLHEVEQPRQEDHQVQRSE